MKVLSEKRMELSQTINLLVASIRTEKGCKRCDFCQSTEDENHRLHQERRGDREDPQAPCPLGLKGQTPAQSIPQYIEVPPNIEGKPIILYLFTILSYLSNPSLLNNN